MNRKKIVSYLLSMVMVISTLFSCVNPVKAIGNVEYTLYAPSNDFQRNIIIVDTEDIAATYELENLYVDNNVIDKTAYNFDGKKIQFHDFQLKK